MPCKLLYEVSCKLLHDLYPDWKMDLLQSTL